MGIEFFGWGVTIVSGAAALVYQTAWVRAFVPLFGLTVYAGAAVIATFIFGLLLGSWAAGQAFVRRAARPWLLYGLIELGIALTGALSPRLPALLAPWYVPLARWSDARAYSLLLRCGFCAAAILLPSALMGMTLPVLIRAMTRPDGDKGRLLARTYSLNALGGALGAALAVFFLLRDWGVAGACVFAAGLNVLAGCASLTLCRRPACDAGAPEAEAGPPAATDRLLWFCAVIGFCSFAFELLWLRLLVFYLQATVYSLGLMLVCCLLGIALGSWSYSAGRTAERMAADPRRVFACLALSLGLVNLLGLRFYGHTDELLLGLMRLFGIGSWRAVAAEEFLAAALVLLPGFFVSGLIFSLLSDVDARARGDASQAMSRVYAANTAGGVLGALAPTFILLDVLGSQRAFELVCLVCAGCGIWLIRDKKPRATAGALLAAFGLVYASTAGHDLVRRNFENGDKEHFRKVVFLRETASDITAVTLVGDKTMVKMGLWPRFGFPLLVYGDGRGTCVEWLPVNRMNRSNAYASMALNPDAKRVLVISMGCGHTAAAFAAFPIQRLDIVDISPNSFAAAKFFPAGNDVVDDPRVHIHVEDGRNFLLRTRQKYDIISLELPSLHTDGVVFLYTEEFYRLARSRLASGGLLMQWTDAHKVDGGITRSLVYAGLRVFRSGVLWTENRFVECYWFSLTDAERPALDYRKVAALFRDRKVLADMKTVHVDLEDVLSTVVASGGVLRRSVEGSPTVSDDKTRVDYSILESTSAEEGFGGLSYYSSPEASIFHERVGESEGPKSRAQAWADFYENSPVAAAAGIRRSLEGFLGGFPPVARRRIIDKAIARMALKGTHP